MDRRRFLSSTLAGAAVAGFPHLAFGAGRRLRVRADVPAMTLSGAETILPKAVVKELGASLHGSLMLPGGEGYDAARALWNGMFDRKPALIAQCSGPADVASAVNFAREHNLLLAVRGGGHSIAGKSVCEGGLMIDLQHMNGVHVDRQRRVARVEGGALLSNLDHETLPLGLATTSGTVSHTGAGGLTLGGGIGRLCRQHGLTSDNLLSVDVVTADGKLRRAAADEHDELFWGLRGGGGNFGVATSFEYQLHPLDNEVLGGAMMYPIEQASEVLKVVNDFSRKAHRELSLSGNLLMMRNGRGFVMMSITYSGDVRKGEKHLRPLLEYGNPVRKGVQKTLYSTLQTANDQQLAAGRHYYMKSGYLPEISDEFIDELVRRVEPSDKREQVVVMTQLGGAIRDLPDDATAYSHRYGEFDLMIGAAWDDAAANDANVTWGRDYFGAVQDYTKGFYTNSLMDESADAIHKNYLGNYPRLQALKNEFDPQNLFRLNANIAPTV
ncbi:MAG: FAD-binding oxidoreductase [Gammaproteobacteria bacterium]|nr:FAD-binding oxidoreductase [Gammaproteobacteria bacterium]NND55373.1 FAD-binding oxidoreductase [Gammaproteobacteria bacterium]